MDNEKQIVYTYRYMWRVKDSSQVNFKIVSDVRPGLDEFEKHLLALPGLESAGREYLHEYDCSLIGSFDKLFNEKEVL